MAETRLEIMWGVPLLDNGFSSIPNTLINNYRKVGIAHGEWGLICQLITFKHDERDPYPTRKTLAECLDCSERQIAKWISSLTKKGLLITGKRKSEYSTWKRTVFNFKPLLDAVYRYIGKKVEQSEDNPTIQWDHNQPVLHGSTGNIREQKQVETQPLKPEVPIGLEPEVPIGLEPEVPIGLEPQVPIKKKTEKEKKKRKKDDDRACASILKSEFISSQLLNESEFERILFRVKEANPFNLFSYARKALLTAVQRKNDLELIHTKKIETEANKTRLKGHKKKRQRQYTHQRPEIPMVDSFPVETLSPANLELARAAAKRLDERKDHYPFINVRRETNETYVEARDRPF